MANRYSKARYDGNYKGSGGKRSVRQCWSKTSVFYSATMACRDQTAFLVFLLRLTWCSSPVAQRSLVGGKAVLCYFHPRADGSCSRVTTSPLHPVSKERDTKLCTYGAASPLTISLSFTGVSCGPPQPDELPEDAGVFTYIFQPSSHILNRIVTSAQLWFYTGSVTVHSSSPSEAATNNSVPEAEVLKLTEQGQIPVATMAVPAAEGWTVFHFGSSFLPYISQKIFVLFVRCPACPCVADEEKIPFLVAITKPKGRDRARRSSVPWSPAALSLLQHPSNDATVHANCHRASLNISFEELSWDKWIVHPSSFVFHYCHGSCVSAHTLTHKPNFQLCCAPLPGTMHSLRVRTTSDGGYSFKYETVPNILTQDCACI